jgi:hypothetical protein
MNEALEHREHKSDRDFFEPYLRGVREYLSGGSEVALGRAYELGRHALAEKMSILEILHLHHAALQRLLEDSRNTEEAVLRGTEAFLAEVLSPYEMTHRDIARQSLHCAA